jgi:hypothetical protein
MPVSSQKRLSDKRNKPLVCKILFPKYCPSSPRITQDFILGNSLSSLRDLILLPGPTQDCVLGYFLSSVPDWVPLSYDRRLR